LHASSSQTSPIDKPEPTSNNTTNTNGKSASEKAKVLPRKNQNNNLQIAATRIKTKQHKQQLVFESN